MTVLIHLDSAYVSFIFLIITELIIVRIVVDSLSRNTDRKLKDSLDVGETVHLDVGQYGPLDVNRGMGRKEMAILVIPATFILLLVSVAEFGISGRTIKTYSNKDTITAGGYYTMFDTTDFEKAPAGFSAKWDTCVEYGDVIRAKQATINYEINNGGLEMGLVTCSDQIGVETYTVEDCTISNSGEEFEIFHEIEGRYDTNNVWSYTYVYSGTGSSSCLETGDRTMFLVTNTRLENSDYDRGFVYSGEYFTKILDFTDEDSNTERWIIESSNGYSSNIVIECTSGCLEAIIEWVSLDSGTSEGEIGNYLSIWYEGLDYGNIGSNACISSDYRLPESEDFSSGNCLDIEPVGKTLVYDGGEENVTEVSVWAMCFVVIGFVFSFIYWFKSREGGYDLLSYKGISKIYYEEVNPNNMFVSGGIDIKFVNSCLRISTMVKDVKDVEVLPLSIPPPLPPRPV